jgi:hypothetical protein
MSKVFRAKYVKALIPKINPDKELINMLFRKECMVFAKRPFGHPKAVLEYPGRYTHKVAISNHRILDIDTQKITFIYKDYRQGNQKLEMSLDNLKFIRRFSMHYLSRNWDFAQRFGADPTLRDPWKFG